MSNDFRMPHGSGVQVLLCQSSCCIEFFATSHNTTVGPFFERRHKHSAPFKLRFFEARPPVQKFSIRRSFIYFTNHTDFGDVWMCQCSIGRLQKSSGFPDLINICSKSTPQSLLPIKERDIGNKQKHLSSLLFSGKALSVQS